MTIVWCMVPETWRATDIIFCHSGPFFTLLPSHGPRKSKFLKKWEKHLKILSFTNINNSHMMYGSWDMEHGRHNFVILDCFLPFLDPENQNFQKTGKNNWRYYHFTNISNSHMMYGSSDMECNGQNFLSSWTIFYLFTP